MAPRTLLLLLAAALTPTQTRAGSHSLRYFETVVSRPGLGEPRFISIAYVDDTQFVRFDSHTENPRYEPREPWVEQEGLEFWELEAQGAKRDVQIFRENLRTALRYYNQSEAAGCDMGSDRSFLCGYEQTAYNSRRRHLTVNEDMKTWTAMDRAAQITRHKWELADFAERASTYLESKCMESLRKHLELGKEILLRTGTPKAHVTHHPRPEGGATLSAGPWASTLLTSP
ncbi:H-2 class I histocompatibility antigen, Q7 alpha chain [Apodemus speciosus]|uniref:H-2 class I histocompatibility antigen, Q7 alpha chain n=1 Tax=Apodemus speciosus TaxID=105296 RepID=A0ABQ0FP37_APOSI